MMSSANVDLQEIAKFQALAEKWWDTSPKSEFYPLHQINPLRLNWISDYSGGLSGKKIVDIGCGGGILAESMARRGADVLGVDLAEAPLAVATLHAEQEQVTNISYRHLPAEQLAAEQAGQYDIVTCMEMLEHVPDPASIVKACFDLVKPGGHVFLSTINRNPKSYLFAIIGAEYVLRLLPRGTHDFKKFIRPSELVSYVRLAGLNYEHITGLHYNPLTKYYWLAPNVDVNYMIHTRRPAL